MNKRCATVVLATGWGLLLVGGLGCGTGEYEKRLDQTVAKLREETRKQTPAASWTRGEVALGDTGIVVHLPTIVDQQPLQSTPEQEIDARRLTIASVAAIQPIAVHEGSVLDTAGGRYFFQCFVAHPEADPSAEIQRQLQALAPGVPVAWTPVECQADDGPKSTWQKIKVTDVNQDVFYVSSSGAESFTPMPCTLAVYQRQIEGQFVVIAWRLPTSIEKSIGPQNDRGFELWANRTAGGVTPQ